MTREELKVIQRALRAWTPATETDAAVRDVALSRVEADLEWHRAGRPDRRVAREHLEGIRWRQAVIDARLARQRDTDREAERTAAVLQHALAGQRGAVVAYTAEAARAHFEEVRADLENGDAIVVTPNRHTVVRARDVLPACPSCGGTGCEHGHHLHGPLGELTGQPECAPCEACGGDGYL